MDLDSARLFRWDDVPEEAVTPMISRKVITGANVMIAQIRLKKGAVVPLHSHEAEQLSLTFSGALKFIIAGETLVAEAGQLLMIPSWVKHEAVAVADTYEMDVFSPIRHDWLNKTDSYFANQPTQAADFTNPASGSNPAKLVTWDQVPVEALSPLTDRAYLSGERATLCDFLLKKGSVVPIHHHESEQISWVRSGHTRLTVAGQVFDVTAGSVLRIPANLPHMAEAIEETRVYDFFSPIRTDWINQTDQYLRQGNR